MKRMKIKKELANKLTRISAYSFVLVTATFLGLWFGMWLDKTTGMTPNFTLLFFFIGTALGFKGFIQEVISERRARS